MIDDYIIDNAHIHSTTSSPGSCPRSSGLVFIYQRWCADLYHAFICISLALRVFLIILAYSYDSSVLGLIHPSHTAQSLHHLPVDVPRHATAGVRIISAKNAWGFLPLSIGAHGAIPILPVVFSSVVQTFFVPRTKNVLGTKLVKRPGLQVHNSATPCRRYRVGQHLWQGFRHSCLPVRFST